MDQCDFYNIADGWRILHIGAPREYEVVQINKFGDFVEIRVEEFLRIARCIGRASRTGFTNLGATHTDEEETMAEFSIEERAERARCFQNTGWTGKQLMEVAVHLQRIETGAVEAHLEEERATQELNYAQGLINGRMRQPKTFQQWRAAIDREIFKTRGQLQSAMFRDEIAEANLLKERLDGMLDRLAKAEAAEAERLEGGLAEAITDADLEDKSRCGIIDDGAMQRALRRSVQRVLAKPSERPGSLRTVIHDPNDPERRRR